MEEQLLYILGYDLRFDEREACAHFAPFMAARIINSCPLTPLTRAAAIERVHRAGRARAQTHLPIPPSEVPPPPLVGSSIVSTVRGIAKRLPSSRLGGTQARTYIASPISSVHSSGSSSATDSEVESLTEDTGSPSDSASSISSDDHEANEIQSSTRKQLVLCTLPQVLREGRKVSEAGSVRSTATARADDSSSPKNSPLPLETCAIRVVDIAAIPSKRASSYVCGMSNGIQNQYDAGFAGGRAIPVPRTKASFNRSSNGFLSRMWSATIKGDEKEKLTCDHSGKGSLGPPVVSIVEPAECYSPGHRISAFQRLVHTRSAIFRATANHHLLDV